MHLSASTSALDEKIAMLLHPSVAADGQERERHLRFMLTRLLVGGVALAAFPVYLALYGQPSGFELLAFACLLLPLASVAVLSRTGSFDAAVAVSSLALSGLVVVLALGSGGVRSPVVIWFVAIPLEAMFTGSLRSIRITMISAVTGLLAVAMLDSFGFAFPVAAWSLHIAIPIMALSALSHVAAVGLAAARNDLHRRASEMARHARDQAVLEAIGDLVAWHDDTGSVTFASQASERLLGVMPRQLLGKGLFDRVQVADRPAYLKALSDAATASLPVTIEMRLHARRRDAAGMNLDPEVIWVEMKAKLIKSSSDEFVVVSVMRDITQAKRHEEEIEAARADAERASDLKGRFLATVSHELRTPLNAIIGFSEILGSDAMQPLESERRQEYARIIHSSGHHLLDVVNTLLDISKIETGNFDLSPETFSLRELVASSCDLMQLKADEGGIELRRDLPNTLPEVVGDPRACRQIVINLLSNAVKFTPSDGEISVALRRDGRNVVLSVADTGIGIAEADLPRLGDPFFQAKSSYDRPYEGTGLGLSVVRGLVGLHNGRMSIESAPGRGTTVTVTLPLDCRLGPSQRSPLLRIEAHPHREGASPAGKGAVHRSERKPSPMRRSA